MEPKENDPRKAIYIHIPDISPSDLDPAMMKWLSEFISQLDDEILDFSNGDPTPLQELEFLDGMVQGDEHPDALKMIMDAYTKHQGEGKC